MCLICSSPVGFRAAETDKWKKISYVFMPTVVAYAFFVMIRHNSHHHDHEEVRARTHDALASSCARRARFFASACSRRTNLISPTLTQHPPSFY